MSHDGGDGLRTLAVCCAQWSAVASGRPCSVPVAILHADRVTSVNRAARSVGVRTGLRRREAQTRCPEVEVFEQDPSRDARLFEPVLSALEAIAPRWELTEPGRCAVPVRGPSRYHGGDRAVAEKVASTVEEALVGALGGSRRSYSVGVGVADGPRAAAVVAEDAARGDRTVVLAEGSTAAHLSPMGIGRLAHGGSGWGNPSETSDLVDVLGRLGLKSLGRFAAVEPTEVLARFGRSGRMAHDFARGRERTLVVLGDIPTELRVSAAVDPPAEQVDRAAFVAKMLADAQHGELASRGLVCTRVLVVVETESGERVERLWRHEGALSATAVAQRVRWQLDGWLSSGRASGRCRGGVSRIELVPEQVVPDAGRQLGFWGGTSEVGERALRALSRVEAMLGHEAVMVPQWRGGRSPGERYRQVPLELAELDARVGRDDIPWPGAVPSPSPAVIWPTPVRAEVTDAGDRRVGVDGRGLMSATPSRCVLGDAPPAEVLAWAGPWCVEERWWDPVAHRRRARLQLMLDGTGGAAHLLVLESGRWWLEATYD